MGRAGAVIVCPDGSTGAGVRNSPHPPGIGVRLEWCDQGFPLIGAGLVVLLFVTSIAAAVNAARLSAHVRQGLSRRSLIFHGLLFYRRDTFDENAGPLFRRFTRSAGLFLGLVLVAIVGSAFAAVRCR